MLWFSATLRVAENRGADFVKCLVPSRSARQNKALAWSPAMLAGQRRD
jgi:queuine/archaeosine tRNA-ribosyltransferase